MIFRQLIHRESCGYTYIVARRAGGDAMIVDPVADDVDAYVELLSQLEVHLSLAAATHTHGTDPGFDVLCDRTGCQAITGPITSLEEARHLGDGEWFELDRMRIQALHTPGHTNDSCCFAMNDRVFTGDTLLIRSTGRTDLETGDPAQQHESLFTKLLWLADSMLVYPAHDYRGWTVSTIAEEKAYNPRLQVRSVEQYVEQMNGLVIADTALMDG